ncbi:hypothetical protein [Pyrodictium abyssi]|uniref:hypothetical protein n=1 Tax=Pyrodictium abyssi TaxID=54256 RepID=UPI0030C6AF39
MVCPVYSCSLGPALLVLGASQAWLILKSGGETVKTYTLAEAYDKLFEPLSESKSTELWASTMYYSMGLLPIAGLIAAAGLVSRRLAAIGGRGTLLALAGLMWIASVYILSNAAPEGYTANTGAGPLLALAGGIAVAAGGTSRGSSAASEAQRRIAGTRLASRARRAVRRSGSGGYSSYSPGREYHYYHDHYREEHYIEEDSSGHSGEDQGRGAARARRWPRGCWRCPRRCSRLRRGQGHGGAQRGRRGGEGRKLHEGAGRQGG